MWLTITSNSFHHEFLIGVIWGFAIFLVGPKVSQPFVRFWKSMNLTGKQIVGAACSLAAMLFLVTIARDVGVIETTETMDQLYFACLIASSAVFFGIGYQAKKQRNAKRIDIPDRRVFEAAIRGNLEAKVNIAVFYLKLSQDPDNGDILDDFHITEENASERAYRHMSDAAKAGYPYAQFNLALMYAHGRGVQQDTRSARYWYALAARQGITQAEHNYALMCAQGQGGCKSLRISYRFFKVSAEKGILHSVHDLAVFLDREEHTGYYHPDLAKDLFRSAARQGEPFSMNTLGVKYSEGISEEETLPMEAIICFMLARRLGNPVASDNCRAIKDSVPLWRWSYAALIASRWQIGQPLPFVETRQ